MAILKSKFGQPITFVDQNCDNCPPPEYCVKAYKSDYVYQQLEQEPCGVNLTDCNFYVELEFASENFDEIADGELPTDWVAEDGECAVESGVCVLENEEDPLNTAILKTDIELTEDSTYRIKFDYKVNAGSLEFFEYSSSERIYETIESGITEGTFDLIYKAEGLGALTFTVYNDAGASNARIDNLVITEIDSCYEQCPTETYEDIIISEDFDDVGTGPAQPAGWTFGGGPTPDFSSNVYMGMSGQPSFFINTNVTLVAGKRYRLTTIYDITAGTLKIGESPNYATSPIFTSAAAPVSGEEIGTFIATGTGPIIIAATGDPDMQLDNFIIDEYCGNQWIPSGDGSICAPELPGRLTYSGTPIEAGYYKVSLEVFNYGAGSLQLRVGDGETALFSGNGIHTFYINSTTTGTVELIATVDFEGCLKGGIQTYKLTAEGEFSVLLYDKNDNFLTDLSSYVKVSGSDVTLKFRWSDLALSDEDLACTKIVWNSQCDELELHIISCGESGDDYPYESEFGTNVLVTCDGGDYTFLKPETNPEPQGDLTIYKKEGFLMLKGVTYKVVLRDFEALYGTVMLSYEIGGISGTITDDDNSTHNIEIEVTPEEDVDTIYISFVAVAYEDGGGTNICSANFHTLRIYIPEVDTDYQTNCIEFIESENCKLKLIRGYSDVNNMGFNFTDADFKLQARLDCLIGRSEYDEEATIGVDSDGGGNYVFGSSQKSQQLMFNRVPAFMHDFISVCKRMPHFLIDGVEYVSEKDKYQPEWVDEAESLPAPSRFRIFKKENNTVFNYNS